MTPSIIRCVVLAGLVVGGSVFGIAASSAAPPTPVDVVSLTEAAPNQSSAIIPGADADVRGSSFTPGEAITLVSQDGVLASSDLVVAADGTFATTLAVGRHLDCGDGVNVLVYASGTTTELGSAWVLSTPCLVGFGRPDNTSLTVRVGQPFVLSGSGFAAGEIVDLHGGDRVGRFLATLSVGSVRSGPDGSWKVTETLTQALGTTVFVSGEGEDSTRFAGSYASVPQSVLPAGAAIGDPMTNYVDLTSPNGQYTALATVGAVFISSSAGYQRIPISSSVAGESVDRLVVQTDGNLVFYVNGRAVWSSHTYGTGSNNRLVMQDDGNLVLYSGGRALWWSGAPRPTLSAGGTLRPGQALTTFSMFYRLVMQGDGNVVLYDFAGRPRWFTGTFVPGSRLVLQGDGNLVVYSPAGRALWNTHTAGAGGGCVLTLRDDGDLILRNAAGRALWSTGGFYPH